MTRNLIIYVKALKYILVYISRTIILYYTFSGSICHFGYSADELSSDRDKFITGISLDYASSPKYTYCCTRHTFNDTSFEDMFDS